MQYETILETNFNIGKFATLKRNVNLESFFSQFHQFFITNTKNESHASEKIAKEKVDKFFHEMSKNPKLFFGIWENWNWTSWQFFNVKFFYASHKIFFFFFQLS